MYKNPIIDCPLFSSRGLMMFLAGGLLSLMTLTSANAGQTFLVTEPTCTGAVGDLAWAVEQANQDPNPPANIRFQEDLTVNLASCRDDPKVKDTGLTITQSVIITGSNFPPGLNSRPNVSGYQVWLKYGTPEPVYNELSCPQDSKQALEPIDPSGLFTIGKRNANNTDIHVLIERFKAESLPWLFEIHRAAKLTVTSSAFTEIRSWLGNCRIPAVTVHTGATFRLIDANLSNFWVNELPSLGKQNSSLIFNLGGTVELLRVNANTLTGTIVRNDADSRADIVSSSFAQVAGGFWVDGQGSTLNLVNTVWELRSREPDVRIEQGIFSAGKGSSINIEASTLRFDRGYFCDPPCVFDDLGAGLLWATQGGHLSLKSTVIGGSFPGAAQLNTIVVEADSSFSNDDVTWIQPTSKQDASALQALDPGNTLLTAPPGITSSETTGSLVDAVSPIVEESGTPGVLLEIIADANCGQANELLNPVDGSCITVDAFGNPRVDVVQPDTGAPYPPGTGFRDAGAVQVGHFFSDLVNYSTHLDLAGTGDGTVSVSWNRLKDPTTDPILGYTLTYCQSGTSACTDLSIPDPNTLTDTVTGLTNGTPYEFVVIPYNASGDGPASNTVTATPFGPIGAPVVTAVAGNEQVELSWSTPDGGGRTIDFYNLSYRVVGTDVWLPAGFIQAPDTFATVTGLKNGTTYEFVVAPFAGIEAGARGSTTAIPHGDIGTVNRQPDQHLMATKRANRPRYWENLGYGDCYKQEVDDTFGSVWHLNVAASALILKTDDTNDLWENPQPGDYGTVTAKDISHAIVCQEGD